MSVIPVRIKILDREYTLRVSPENKAQIYRAAEALNQALSQKQRQFSVLDKQDLLSFVAFDGFFEALRQQDETETVQVHLEKLTETINESIPTDVSTLS